MGCGCAKRMARSKKKKQEAMAKKAGESEGKVIRKRRVNKLISIPGRSSRRKAKEM
mgnify:CR=1 FL=1